VLKAADYVIDNYNDKDAQYLSSLWTLPPDMFGLVPYTNNGAEAYHSHLNAEFYSKHPNIFTFVDVIYKNTTEYVCVNEQYDTNSSYF
jgi:hypothetical protein